MIFPLRKRWPGQGGALYHVRRGYPAGVRGEGLVGWLVGLEVLTPWKTPKKVVENCRGQFCMSFK